MGSIEERQRLLIEMVMRQTNYSYEDAESNLVKNRNDYMKVIREAIGVTTKETESVTSINQGIYKEIRGMMDTAAASHRRKEELEEKKEQLITYLKNQKDEKDKEKLGSLTEIIEETTDEATDEVTTDEVTDKKKD